MQRTAYLESLVRAWAEQHGCSLRVLNDGHHWLFQKASFVAEWWPSSAKLAVNRNYAHTFHTPHWDHVETVLQQHLDGTGTPRSPGPLSFQDSQNLTL